MSDQIDRSPGKHEAMFQESQYETEGRGQVSETNVERLLAEWTNEAEAFQRDGGLMGVGSAARHLRAALEADRVAPEPVPEGPAVEALRTIIANARTIPDPRMGDTTDVYAVPIEDIEAAHAALYAAPEGAVPVTVRSVDLFDKGRQARLLVYVDPEHAEAIPDDAWLVPRRVEPGEQEGESE